MPLIKYNKATIESNIEAVKASEKITKAKLSVLSRDLLAYVYDTNDVAMVTRLLKVLTPVNKRVACLYFPTFLGWSFNDKELTFGKKLKSKVFDKKLEATTAWLEDEANDIWLWSDNEIELKAKPKDYANKLTQLVTKALLDEEEGISAKDVLYAILNSDAITLGDLMEPLKELKDVNNEDKAA